jgi:hypothetical protein
MRLFVIALKIGRIHTEVSGPSRDTRCSNTRLVHTGLQSNQVLVLFFMAYHMKQLPFNPVVKLTIFTYSRHSFC